MSGKILQLDDAHAWRRSIIDMSRNVDFITFPLLTLRVLSVLRNWISCSVYKHMQLYFSRAFALMRVILMRKRGLRHDG